MIACGIERLLILQSLNCNRFVGMEWNGLFQNCSVHDFELRAHTQQLLLIHAESDFDTSMRTNNISPSIGLLDDLLVSIVLMNDDIAEPEEAFVLVLNTELSTITLGRRCAIGIIEEDPDDGECVYVCLYMCV